MWKVGRNRKETYGYDSNESLAPRPERMVTLVSEYYCRKGFVTYEAVVHLIRQKAKKWSSSFNRIQEISIMLL